MAPAREALAPMARRMTREEYHRLIDAGWFHGERVELIHGTPVTMSPKNVAHSWVTQNLWRLLYERYGSTGSIRVQDPLLSHDESEPEPDIAVVPPGDYLATSHPDQAWLVVEVAESSLRYDLGVKASLYAQSGVERYWVVDLVRGEVVEHDGPRSDGTWAAVTRHPRGHRLLLPRIDAELAVDELLPPVGA